MKKMWFKILSTKNVVCIELQQHKNNNWSPNILSEYPFSKTDFSRKKVVISGKAPNWMYAATALAAYQNNAKSINIKQADNKVSVKIFPIKKSNCNESFFEVKTIDDSVIFNIIPKMPGKKWSANVQYQFSLFFEKYKCFKHCCLTGRGANWMYASFVVQTVIAGVKKVSCFIPREFDDKIIVFYNNAFIENNIKILEHNKKIVDKLHYDGIVIGIVGDPNSGKSVFSAVLAACAFDLNINVWTLDCDGASPTPKWFTAMLRNKKAEQATQIRKNQKVEWNHQLEKNIAKQIKNLKNSCQLTIADMPGGDHRNKNNIMRIPPRREVIMKAVDKFIIIGRKTEKIADLWIKELKKHNLENKVIAIIDSHSPNTVPESFIKKSEDNIFRGEISGLDRKNEISLLTKTFKKSLSKILVEFQ